MSIGFDERRRAFEEVFFARLEKSLLARLRKRIQREGELVDLARVCGIDDPASLDALLSVGIEAETVAALALVPLVAVAWASGRVEKEEREAVLAAAVQVGIEDGSPTYGLLYGWLVERPGRKLFESWERYVLDLSDHLDREQVRVLRRDLAARARRVAEAAGGLLGIGSISANEHAVIDRIERDLSDVVSGDD